LLILLEEGGKVENAVRGFEAGDVDVEQLVGHLPLGKQTPEICVRYHAHVHGADTTLPVLRIDLQGVDLIAESVDAWVLGLESLDIGSEFIKLGGEIAQQRL
jgi:hypothetical protein